MHANTFESKTDDKLKTRKYSDILSELNQFKQLIDENGFASGISLEATYEDVSECVDGAYPFE